MTADKMNQILLPEYFSDDSDNGYVSKIRSFLAAELTSHAF